MDTAQGSAVDRGDGVASAFYSHDFDWECLREEVENKLSVEEETTKKSLETGTGDDNDREDHLRASSWEAFHKRHSAALFFKERRYLLKEFPELRKEAHPLLILEVGCGTGSSVVPILRGNNAAQVYACDCSLAALEKARAVVDNDAGLSSLQSEKFHPFLCDLPVQTLPNWLCCITCQQSFETPIPTTRSFPERHNEIFQKPNPATGELDRSPEDQRSRNEGLLSSVSALGTSEVANNLTMPKGGYGKDRAVGTTSKSAFNGSPSCELCLGGVDVATMVFTLSAMRPEIMPAVLNQIFAAIKPGGLLLFRDYGLYDMTMLRFPASRRVGDRLYRRMDGTLCYYFSCDILRRFMLETGFLVEEVYFCCVQVVNRKTQRNMKRVWIHGKFRRPIHETRLSTNSEPGNMPV